MWLPFSFFQTHLIRHIKIFLDFLVLFAALVWLHQLAGIVWAILFGAVYIGVNTLKGMLENIIIIEPDEDEDGK